MTDLIISIITIIDLMEEDNMNQEKIVIMANFQKSIMIMNDKNNIHKKLI